MTAHDLTKCTPAAKSPLMQVTAIKPPTARWARAQALVLALSGATLMSGCVSVNAPDKPIVIELNINIKQEVVYRLAADAKGTIEGNPDAF